MMVNIVFVSVATASSSVVVSTSTKLPRCIIITRIVRMQHFSVLSSFVFSNCVFSLRRVQCCTAGDSFRVDLFEFIHFVEMLIVLFAFRKLNEIIN